MAASIHLNVFDPSEIKLTLKTKDNYFDVYGFSTGKKIWFEGDTLKFKTKALSESNKELFNFLQGSDKISIEVILSSAQDHPYLKLFSGKMFVLSIDSAEICGDNIPTITYKLNRPWN